MDTVKVKKDELIGVVRGNRDAHRGLFLKAQEGFRARIIDELDKRLTEAKAGRDVDISIRLAPPVDQTKDYDRVIRMLEMSVDEFIELDPNEFANYVMDDWSWSANARILNSTYAAFSSGSNQG